jgi:hypothetical protein
MTKCRINSADSPSSLATFPSFCTLRNFAVYFSVISDVSQRSDRERTRCVASFLRLATEQTGRALVLARDGRFCLSTLIPHLNEFLEIRQALVDL